MVHFTKALLILNPFIWNVCLGKGTPNFLDNVCLQPACIKTAAQMFKNMNLSADPCSDFYEFSCGKFQKESIIPDDQSKWSIFERVRKDVFAKARILLDKEITSNDWDASVKAKKHYHSCVNTEKLEELGVEPLKKLLRHVGGWPVVEGAQWNQTGYTWHDQVLKMKEAGVEVNYIFNIYVGKDKNASRRALSIDQPKFLINKEFFVRDTEFVRTHYYEYMRNTAILLGADPKNEKLNEELKDIIKFETKLAKLSANLEARRNGTNQYNPAVMKNMRKLRGHPPSWSQFMNKFISNVPINESDILIIRDANYFWNVSVVLAESDDRTIANYLGWRLAESMMRYLNEDARNIVQDIQSHYSGESRSSSRWEVCIREVGFDNYDRNSLRIAMGSMFVKNYFSEDARDQVRIIVKYVKDALQNDFMILDWMDEKTRKEALMKLNHTSEFVAYPEELLNQTIIDDFFAGLVIKDDDFFGNVLRINKWHSNYTFSQLREIVDRQSWTEQTYVALVNAFYEIGVNALSIPAGFLQTQTFHVDLPYHTNFGRIGIVIGHELTHGFDDIGSQYDENGNLDDWWDHYTKEAFKQKVRCIVEQYSAYKSNQVNLTLNGIGGRGENIADNGGYKLAFKAYEKWLMDNNIEEEPKIPGFDFTSKQFFWISVGQFWCAKLTDEAMRNNILAGYHAPPKFRLIGPLSNNADFSKAFNCPLGSPMNPERKCIIW